MDKEKHCPKCGAVVDDYFRSKLTGKIVGCESCLKVVYWYELSDEEAADDDT